MLTIGKITCPEDIEECARIHQSQLDTKFYPTSITAEVASISSHLTRRAFFRLLRKDDKIVAWLLAVKTIAEMSGKPVLYQLVYASSLKGFGAATAVKLLHQELIQEGKKLRVSMVISSGGFMEEDNKFSKLLEIYGWERKGYMALYKLNKGN